MITATERFTIGPSDPRAVFGTTDESPPVPDTRAQRAYKMWHLLLERGFCPGLMDARSIVFMPFPPGGPFHAS
jgi:hypothetical protein